ncbi:uncharacterized protein [Hetaerina americana]|uniref:uncharacterized protein n=1 Tax=Hetaerina americana TaxID=62018 RepID=UPI003A7F4BEC
MDTYSVKGEVFRLLLKKSNLKKQEVALTKMLDVIDKQLLGLEVEGYQLASEVRMKEDPDEGSGSELEEMNSDTGLVSEEELNKTKLSLDSRLDDMLSGNFCVEEDEDDEMEDLIVL